jgi:hypothetical protein
MSGKLPVTDEREHWLPPVARKDAYKPSFDKNARNELRRLGVTQEQLLRLEPGLRIIKVYTDPIATLAEVRRPLGDLSKSVQRTAQLLDSILTAPRHDKARTEAVGRLQNALFEVNPDRFIPRPSNPILPSEPLDDIFGGIRAALIELRQSADMATEQIPRSQSRSVAHSYPIRYIDTALLQGSIATHKASGLSPKDWPEYLFNPSASDASNFRQIVSICYEAAGAANADPLRAIRNYLRSRKGTRAALSG